MELKSGAEYSVYEEKPLRVQPIRWRKLSEIRPHEAVHKQALESFCNSLRKKGLFYKPILIDGESGTILDGTHRWAGLREMGAKQVPTIEFDYLNDQEIKVFTWYPITDQPARKVLKIVEKLADEIEALPPEQTFYPPPNGDQILLTNDLSYRLKADDIKFFKNLGQELDLEFVQDYNQLVKHINGAKQGCGFLRQPPSRAQVIEIAQSGESVPAKATRHWLPFKYQHIMVKIEEIVP
ncbi:MAG: ParB N-terminal domain-containing protein [bacterium]